MYSATIKDVITNIKLILKNIIFLTHNSLKIACFRLESLKFAVIYTCSCKVVNNGYTLKTWTKNLFKEMGISMNDLNTYLQLNSVELY